MAQPPGSTNPPVPLPLLPRGSERGGIRPLALEDIRSLALSPDWFFVPEADILAATPTYTMPAVPAGMVRLIVEAWCMDESGANIGDQAFVQIQVVMPDGSEHNECAAAVVTPVAASTWAVCRLGRVLVLASGCSLRLVGQTDLIGGGIRYLDVIL